MNAETIQYNQSIIIRSEKCYRVYRVVKGQVLINKFRFSFQNAIGQPFGSTFEIKNHHLIKVSSDVTNCEQGDDVTSALDCNGESIIQKSIFDRSDDFIDCVDNMTDDNNKIATTLEVQKIKAAEVLKLKSEGVSTDELIEKLVENNANFAHRTEFSQQKYIKKKQRKHSNIICIMKPSLR